MKRPIYLKILPIENHKFKSEIENDINKLVNRWFNRLKAESINKESVFVAPEEKFDVGTSKFFYLMLWTKNNIKEKPGNLVKTLDLFTRYKEYMKDAYGDESSIPEGRFYKEIGTMMSMFRIQNTKIKTLGDRGYAGVNYYDSENTTEYLQDRGTTDSYPSDDTADSRKSENTITIEEASKN